MKKIFTLKGMRINQRIPKFDPYSEKAERGLHFNYSCQGHLTNFYIVSQPGEVPKSGVPVPISGKNLFPQMGRKTANAGLKSSLWRSQNRSQKLWDSHVWRS